MLKFIVVISVTKDTFFMLTIAITLWYATYFHFPLFIIIFRKSMFALKQYNNTKPCYLKNFISDTAR